jgi:dolichyl-phosphate-mannose--protein O-mannosyl transferase
MGRVTYLHHYVCLPIFPFKLDTFPSPPAFTHALTHTHIHTLPQTRTIVLVFVLANKQLPTLWFAVLMAGHVLNHLIFDSQRLSPGARFIWFVIWTGSVIVNFWWFKDFALGIYGPVNDHKGWLWRGSWNVSQARVPVRATFRS